MLLVGILQEYKARFGEAFKSLCSQMRQDRFYGEDLVKSKDPTEYLSEISAWLKSLPTHKVCTMGQ